MDTDKLISWLEAEMYIYKNGDKWIVYGEELVTSEEFENIHRWEISRNRMIKKQSDLYWNRYRISLQQKG